ncbi:MAG: CoA-binding protein [Gammaproteobacteria bacterium]|nr:CoA-binding protein [Gammaproteobacteria bacterium]MDE0443396.1 CoA-binding protein [Gammaproteobacteria bacterium]
MDIADYQNPRIIRAALGERRVAIVGLSSNELRASHFVGYYLKRHGYDIVPVNPRETSILGCECYPSLTDIADPVGVVDVFRASDAVPEIARQAVAIGAHCLWLQYGVINEEGIEIARGGGLDVIVDRCLKVEHARYLGRMHWLGFNTEVVSAERREV